MSINGARSSLNLAGDTSRSTPRGSARSPIILGSRSSARAATADVIARVQAEINRAQMTAQRHRLDGCPRPGRCAPCRAEERREHREADAAMRRRAIEQHAVSVGRVAAALRLDAKRIEATRKMAPGARCAVCRTGSDGTRSCRECGAVEAPPEVIEEALAEIAKTGVGRAAPQVSVAEYAAFTAAMRARRRCPGCGDRSETGRVCGPCGEGV